jgi:hypothetical protein
MAMVLEKVRDGWWHLALPPLHVAPVDSFGGGGFL